MIGLSRLVEAPGVSSIPYVDPAFRDRPLVLHAARPRDFHVEIPILFVHHGVRRNGSDYRDYWLELVDQAGVLAIAIEFPEASFQNICGIISAICKPRMAGTIRGWSGRLGS
jgi:hypothetical protein